MNTLIFAVTMLVSTFAQAQQVSPTATPHCEVYQYDKSDSEVYRVCEHPDVMMIVVPQREVELATKVEKILSSMGIKFFNFNSYSVDFRYSLQKADVEKVRIEFLKISDIIRIIPAWIYENNKEIQEYELGEIVCGYSENITLKHLMEWSKKASVELQSVSEYLPTVTWRSLDTFKALRILSEDLEAEYCTVNFLQVGSLSN